MNFEAGRKYGFLFIKAVFTTFLLLQTISAFSDVSKYIEKAKNYQKTRGSSSSKVDSILSPKPLGRIIDNTPPTLSESDKRYILVHMKLANRNFSKKKYDRAISEVELVFERQPDHAGGRFMRAVIAARQKDYKTAWHNINVSKEKDPENSKIKSFTQKLNSTSPEPKNKVGVTGILRPLPTFICEKICDVVERLLKDKCSHNIIAINFPDYVISKSSTKIAMVIDCSSNVEKNDIISVIKEASGSEVTVTHFGKVDNGNYKLSLSFEISGLPFENPNLKPASNLIEFVQLIAEETDIAISNSVEDDMPDHFLKITYETSIRDFKSLNDFLRKVSPYAKSFKVNELELAYIRGTNNIIWKTKVQIVYKLSQT